MAELDLNYYFTCFAAPVQAEGTLFGYPFYFRSRHEHWSFSLSEHDDLDPVDIQTEEGAKGYGFFREERYGSEKYDASYMSIEDAEAIIKRCAEEYARERMHASSTASSIDIASVRHLLPEHIIGEITSVVPIHMGLSGAGVYEVRSSRGDYILRIQGKRNDESFWLQQLLILRRAAEHGIAPALVHVDEEARAIIMARIAGAPLHMALADPAARQTVIGGVVAQLRALHAIDPAGIAERDGVGYARGLWERQRQREGFPEWCANIGAMLDEIAAVLARDTRRVVSHNDINPGNVLWDGTRAWLIDWEAAGLMHPYYDIAALSTFLNLDADAGYGLLALQEQNALDDDARATFVAMRKLVALAAGSIFLSLVPDLSVLPAPTLGEAPTLAIFYDDMRTGELQLQTPKGQAAFGLALLRNGIELGS